MACDCGKKASFRRCQDLTLLSSIGHVTVNRRYYACRGDCKAKQTPFDQWAGITGPHRVTPHVRRMIVLAGSSCSFDEAAGKLLKELSQLRTSNDVIRAVCDEEGQAIQQWVNSSPEPQKAFAKAEGIVEFSTDGLKLNTTTGWKEIRLSVMGKREAVDAAPAAAWEDRPLEAPTMRMAICAIAPCEEIGASWERLAQALGIPKDQDLSVIADGAKWIWNQAAQRFKGADVQWVVDVYHLMLYLYAVVTGLGKEAAEEWVGNRVIELIEMGGLKFIEHLKAVGAPGPILTTGASQPEAWAKLLHYLEENRDSLWYDRRMKEGLPIGSGLIEGGCKNVLAKRLKLNSARWKERRAEHMGAIRCLQYSEMWETYWDSKKAAA